MAGVRDLSFLLDLVGITAEPSALAKESKSNLAAAWKWATAYRKSAVYNVKVPKKPEFLNKYPEWEKSCSTENK